MIALDEVGASESEDKSDDEDDDETALLFRFLLRFRCGFATAEAMI